MEELEKQFIQDIVPGNYWITKSMEFTKKETSGTLWYLKKFLLFYYFLFFTDRFETVTGVVQICEQIDSFINSLPEEVRSNAEAFFYPNGVDLKTDDHKSFSKFISRSGAFVDNSDKRNFLLTAKKYYFMYLMGFGGQANHKKAMKEILSRVSTFEDFMNESEEYFDEQGLDAAKKREMRSDFPAAIRNERQIYFYYGFLHGTEASSLGGFYKFTAVGRAVIQANFHELLIIWEHQKLRMVSQSPITEINNLEYVAGLSDDKKQVIIDRVDNMNHPYYTLLTFLNSTDSVDPTTYKYIAARSKNHHGLDDLNRLVAELNRSALVEGIDSQLAPYHRKGDAGSEDFEKERKKYILGIRQLSLDAGTNYFAFLDDEGQVIINAPKAELVLSVYKTIVHNLDLTSAPHYEEFRRYLKLYYSEQINSSYDDTTLNKAAVQFNWYNYIINFDRTTTALLIYASIRLRENVSAGELTATDIRKYYGGYSELIAGVLGLKSQKEFLEIIFFINDQFTEGQWDKRAIHDLRSLLKTDADENFIRYEGVIEATSLEKLQEYSLENTNKTLRERDPRIIKAMRGYYQANFKNAQGLIECDSCGITTFINQSGLAYLEFHHIIPYSLANGPDHYLNLAGICPLCHRKFHNLNRPDKPQLYKDFEQKNHLKKDLNQRLESLYNDNALEPLHLDYLVAEGAISQDKKEEMLGRDIVIEKL